MILAIQRHEFHRLMGGAAGDAILKKPSEHALTLNVKLT